MPDYLVYGLVVRSDRALHGLEAAPMTGHVDVTVTLGTGAAPAAEWAHAPIHYLEPGVADEPPAVEVRRDEARGYWFRYGDGTEFTLDREASVIGAWWRDASTIEDTATYLLGPVLGYALRLRGVLALHASAVLIDGRAVALVGPSGAGKSTTAAAFAAAGTPVLTDDVLALRPGSSGAVLAYPAYRLLRLWDASERIVFGTAGQLPLLTPTWDKRGLPLGEDFPFHAQPAELGDVFVFAARSGDERAPYAEPMRARNACMALVANSYANYLLDDAMRAHELRALEALLRGRRVHRLVPHEDPARLTRLVDVVRATLRDA